MLIQLFLFCYQLNLLLLKNYLELIQVFFITLQLNYFASPRRKFTTLLIQFIQLSQSFLSSLLIDSTTRIFQYSKAIAELLKIPQQSWLSLIATHPNRQLPQQSYLLRHEFRMMINSQRIDSLLSLQLLYPNTPLIKMFLILQQLLLFIIKHLLHISKV